MALLVVLYSINVFITFVLSQLGMVRHWWQERHRERRWRRGAARLALEAEDENEGDGDDIAAILADRPA